MNYLVNIYWMTDLLNMLMYSSFHLLNKFLGVAHGLDFGNVIMGKIDVVPTLIKLPVFHFTRSHKLCYFWISYFYIDNAPLRISSALVINLPGNDLLIGLYYWMFTSCLAQTSTKMINAGVSCPEFICTSLTNYNFAFFCQSS